MEKTLIVNTFINDAKSREMDIRDIMGSMEELASMIGIRSSSYNCKILSIEPPGVSAHNPGIHPEGPHKKHLQPTTAQVLPFKKIVM